MASIVVSNMIEFIHFYSHSYFILITTYRDSVINNISEEMSYNIEILVMKHRKKNISLFNNDLNIKLRITSN